MAAGLYDITNETLGKGHFAVVKLARHCLTGELVAVKIIDKLRLKNENLHPLGQEIRLLSRLCEKPHPNIVKLYQVIDTKYKLYLVMEYSGRDVCDLYDFIQKHNQGNGIRDSEAKHIFRQICSAIAYCHSMRIVHRDLKPENILIVNKPEEQECSGYIQYPLVKLIDFGFSNQWKEGEKLRTSCGSLAYSAPEILLGDQYDGDKVDVWGLGCILYILLYGSNPFMQINDSETLIRILDCSYTAPPRPNVNEKAIELIKSLLRKEPLSRFTVQQVLSHSWLSESSPTVGSFQAAIPSVPASDVSSTDSSIAELPISSSSATTMDKEMLELKRKLGQVKTERESSTYDTITNTMVTNTTTNQLSKSFLHDKVIEQMLAQSMCSSKEQIELALQRSKEFANRAPARFGRQAENDENRNQNAINQIVHRNGSSEFAGNAVMISNLNDNKLINEQHESIDSAINMPTLNKVETLQGQTKLIGQDAYITATYHLLKDKLFREHHGITVTNQITSKTTHHKKVLPNRPRKSIIKPPTFGLSTLKATEEEQEPPPEPNSSSSSNGILGLPFEEDPAFTLPLARKCSIVSEEGSCVGGDYSGNECDSVLDHSNFHSLESDGSDVGHRQTMSNNRIQQQPVTKFPIVDIIVTDYSEYEQREEEDDDEMVLEVTQTHHPCESTQERLQEEEEEEEEEEDMNESDVDNSEKTAFDQFIDVHPNDPSKLTRPKLSSAVDDEEEEDKQRSSKSMIEKPQDNKMNVPLHLTSSSPDLLRNEVYQMPSNNRVLGEGVAGELLISQRELDVCDDFIGQHLKSQHLQNYNNNNSSTVANGSTMRDKQRIFPGNSSSFLHTSMRIITQSKSCNNILLNDDVDGVEAVHPKCNKKKKKKKKKSRKGKKLSPTTTVHTNDTIANESCTNININSTTTAAAVAPPLPPLQLDPNGLVHEKSSSSKKHRNEKIECCSLC